MIPVNWTEHRRDDDNELLGFLRPTDAGVVPVTVFGYPLGEPADEADGERVLESVGLSYLADTWTLAVEGRPEPISVRIVEASPETLVVQNVDYGYEGDIGTRFTLDVPVAVDRFSR